MRNTLLLATATLELHRDGRVLVRDVDTADTYVPGYVLGCFDGPDFDDFTRRRGAAIPDLDEFDLVVQSWTAHNRDAEDPLAAVAEWGHLYLSTRGVQ